MTMPHTLSTYRKLAKVLLRQIRAGDQAAIQRFRATSASLTTASDAEAQAVASLMRCQHVIAVEHGAQDWTDLTNRLGGGSPATAAAGGGEDLILGHGVRWSESFVRDMWGSSRVSLGVERCTIPPDAFPRHLAVLGDCGRGKSTFLRRLTAQVMCRRDASIIVIVSKFEQPWADICGNGRAIRRELARDHLEIGGWDRPGTMFYAGEAMRDHWGTSEATGRIVTALIAQPPQRECWLIIDEPLLDLPVRGAGVPWVEPGSAGEPDDQPPRLPSGGRMRLITCSQMEPDPRVFLPPDAYLMFSTRHRDLVTRIHGRLGHQPGRSAAAAVLADAPIGSAVLANGQDSWVIAATGSDEDQLSHTTWAI